MDYNLLIVSAIKAKKNAYAPYSNFRVGAAVFMENRKIYDGCNIENASYGATNCAERTAIFKAISDGSKKIKAIAIVGSEEEYTYPCGICRQVISEFAAEDMKIIIAKNQKEYVIKKLDEILPQSFTKKNLNK